MTIELDYVERHPSSQRLHRRASSVLPSGVTHDGRYMRPFPVYVERAQGSRKWDVDGLEYVDYVMGHGALLLGHNHPVVAEAVAGQATRGTHYGASHELEVRWAELVTEIVPSAEMVRFTSSGTEATLMALRLARAHTGKPAVLKFEQHFHGWHDYVISSWKYGAAAPPGVPDATLESVEVVPPEMHVVREAIASRPDIGAVIVEASGASMGTIPLPRDFLRELRAFTQERGLVLIFDEVVTGFRWAAGGVQELEGVTPDLTALAKILAGGLPGGAVAGQREIMERLEFRERPPGEEKIGHPGTFNANPLSAAAGVACLSEVRDGRHQLLANATASQLRASMNAALRDAGVPGVVYGQASVFRILLNGDHVPEARDYDGRDIPLERIRAGMPGRVQNLMNLSMLNHGVQVFGNGGIVSSVHTAADVDRTIEAWTATLRALRAEGVV
ncbi:MAG: aminotransferase class III-fold pyridoxal phosphate-dependent enzyme [Dehalococcoidia bacterium]